MSKTEREKEIEKWMVENEVERIPAKEPPRQTWGRTKTVRKTKGKMK